MVRFSELLKLRGLAMATQEEYMRFARKLLDRLQCAPEAVSEEQLRAHLLRLKEEHHYSPSSMRTAVAAMRAFFGLHLGHEHLGEGGSHESHLMDDFQIGGDPLMDGQIQNG